MTNWIQQAARHIENKYQLGDTEGGIASIIAEHAAPLTALLEESRRKHYHCDDSYYCCKACAHPDHPSKWIDPSEPCTCGASDWNSRLDAALAVSAAPGAANAGREVEIRGGAESGRS